MGFLDKLLGRDKSTVESAPEAAHEHSGDVAAPTDDDLSETGQAEQRLDDARDQALRDEGRMP